MNQTQNQAQKQAQKQAQRNVLSVRIGSQWYGINVANVIEILNMVMLSEIPASSPDMLGLMVLRNVVMPVVDLRVRFGISQPDYRLDTPIITLRTERGSLGVVVDEIDNVEQVGLEHISDNLGANLPFIAGTAQLPNKLLMLLDIAALNADSSINSHVANNHTNGKVHNSVSA